MAPLGLGLEITELRLGLPGSGSDSGSGNDTGEMRVFSSIRGGVWEDNVYGCSDDGGENRNTDLVIGWPPVCLRRKKGTFDVTKNYVKVSMDGAPILRKVDLSCCKGYSDLGKALEKLFDCYGIGEAMKEESESCEYVAIYEDKDGDWMLVGDVPWLMFTETCKRLRIKKR